MTELSHTCLHSTLSWFQDKLSVLSRFKCKLVQHPRSPTDPFSHNFNIRIMSIYGSKLIILGLSRNNCYWISFIGKSVLYDMNDPIGLVVVIDIVQHKTIGLIPCLRTVQFGFVPKSFIDELNRNKPLGFNSITFIITRDLKITSSCNTQTYMSPSPHTSIFCWYMILWIVIVGGFNSHWSRSCSSPI